LCPFEHGGGRPASVVIGAVVWVVFGLGPLSFEFNKTGRVKL
jgi:hypothetical protein